MHWNTAGLTPHKSKRLCATKPCDEVYSRLESISLGMVPDIKKLSVDCGPCEGPCECGDFFPEINPVSILCD